MATSERIEPCPSCGHMTFRTEYATDGADVDHAVAGGAACTNTDCPANTPL
jgi:hypothetical protein